jgi:hypothetical protein
MWTSAQSSIANFSPARALRASMPPALLDRPHLKLDGVALTPRHALAAIGSGSDLGRHIAEVVAAGGIVALTQPDEARFRKWARRGRAP